MSCITAIGMNKSAKLIVGHEVFAIPDMLHDAFLKVNTEFSQAQAGHAEHRVMNRRQDPLSNLDVSLILPLIP